MRQTKKITLSAMIVALSAAFMALGGLVEVLDLSVLAFVSLLVAFVYIEIGSPYTWLVWLCSSLAAFLLVPGSIVWVEYLTVFGIYPILKAYIEKLRRPIWLPIKLIYINAVLWGLFFTFEILFDYPIFIYDKLWIKIAVYFIANVAFVAYDLFLTVLIRAYFQKIRNRFKHLLK